MVAGERGAPVGKNANKLAFRDIWLHMSFREVGKAQALERSLQKSDSGAYDREVFLVLKEFAPSFSRGGDMAMDFLAGEPISKLQQMGRAADDEAKDQGV